MTEIRFYHLEQQSQMHVLPIILSKALERGHRIVMKLPHAQALEQMNAHLWNFSADHFLPHGTQKGGKAASQPIWLTTEDENPNEGDLLIICQGAFSTMQGDFKLCCEMLDGHDQEAITAARARWKTYKAQDFNVTYWQQNEAGRWDKKG